MFHIKSPVGTRLATSAIPNVRAIMNKFKPVPITDKISFGKLVTQTNKYTLRQKHEGMLCIATYRLFQHHPNSDADTLGLYTPILWHDKLTGFFEKVCNDHTLAAEQIKLLQKLHDEGTYTLDCMKLTLADCTGLYEGKGFLLSKFKKDTLKPAETEELLSIFCSRYMGTTSLSLLEALSKANLTTTEIRTMCTAPGGIFMKARQLLPDRSFDFQPIRLHGSWNRAPATRTPEATELENASAPEPEASKPTSADTPNTDDALEETAAQDNNYDADDTSMGPANNDPVPTPPPTNKTPILLALGIEGQTLTDTLTQMTSNTERNHYISNIVKGYYTRFYPPESHDDIRKVIDRCKPLELSRPMLRIPGYFRNKLRFSSASQHADSFRNPPESSEENHAPNEPLIPLANAQQDPVNAYTPVTIAMNIECTTLDTVINSTRSQEEKKQYLLDVLQGYVSMYYPLSTQQTIIDAVSDAEPDELRHAILPLPGYLLEYMQQYGERDISPDFHASLQDAVTLIEEESTELPPAPKPDGKPPAEEPTVPHPSSFPTSSTRKGTAATTKKHGKKPKTPAQPRHPGNTSRTSHPRNPQSRFRLRSLPFRGRPRHPRTQLDQTSTMGTIIQTMANGLWEYHTMGTSRYGREWDGSSAT